jgi:hypothetical protein
MAFFILSNLTFSAAPATAALSGCSLSRWSTLRLTHKTAPSYFDQADLDPTTEIPDDGGNAKASIQLQDQY